MAKVSVRAVMAVVAAALVATAVLVAAYAVQNSASDVRAYAQDGVTASDQVCEDPESCCADAEEVYRELKGGRDV